MSAVLQRLAWWIGDLASAVVDAIEGWGDRRAARRQRTTLGNPYRVDNDGRKTIQVVHGYDEQTAKAMRAHYQSLGIKRATKMSGKELVVRQDELLRKAERRIAEEQAAEKRATRRRRRENEEIRRAALRRARTRRWW